MKLREYVEKRKQDATEAIEDFRIDGSSGLDSAIKFYRGKIAAFDEVLSELEGQPQ